MRLPLRRSGLLAAAALAGGVVYWRVAEQRRTRQAGGEIDDAIAEGRAAADRILDAARRDRDRFEPS